MLKEFIGAHNISYDGFNDKDGKPMLRIRYLDLKGIIVVVLVRPNPVGASQLLDVNWGGKHVDPLPTDNMITLDVEAEIRKGAKNIAELEGIKFCSLWTFSPKFNFQTRNNRGEREFSRSQNVEGERSLAGRLWTSENIFGNVVYWTRHFVKVKDGFLREHRELGKPTAWLAVESGKYVTLKDNHQKLVDKLFELIVLHDEKQLAIKKD